MDLDIHTEGEKREFFENPYNDHEIGGAIKPRIPTHKLVFPKPNPKKLEYIDDELEAHRATRGY